MYGLKGSLNAKNALKLISKEKWSNNLIALFEHHFANDSDLLHQLISNVCSGLNKETESVALLKFLSLLSYKNCILRSLQQKIMEILPECGSPLVKTALLEFAKNSLPRSLFNVHLHMEYVILLITSIDY